MDWQDVFGVGKKYREGGGFGKRKRPPDWMVQQAQTQTEGRSPNSSQPAFAARVNRSLEGGSMSPLAPRADIKPKGNLVPRGNIIPEGNLVPERVASGAKDLLKKNLPTEYSEKGLREWGGRPVREIPQAASAAWRGYSDVVNRAADRGLDVVSDLTRKSAPGTREEAMSRMLPPYAAGLAPYAAKVAENMPRFGGRSAKAAVESPIVSEGMTEGSPQEQNIPMTYGEPAEATYRPQAAPTAVTARANNAAKKRQVAPAANINNWRDLPENQRPIELIRGNTMTYFDPKTRAEFATVQEALRGEASEETDALRQRAHEIALEKLRGGSSERVADIKARADRYATDKGYFPWKQVDTGDQLFDDEPAGTQLFHAGSGEVMGATGPQTEQPRTLTKKEKGLRGKALFDYIQERFDKESTELDSFLLMLDEQQQEDIRRQRME